MEYALWSHAFGGVNEDEIWSLVVYEDSDLSPDDLVRGTTTKVRDHTLPHRLGKGTLTYLTSWDHPPTDEERAAVTPDVYRKDH